MILNNFWKTRWPPQPIFCWLRILTTSDQLKEKLWIYHHQILYVDIRWHYNKAWLVFIFNNFWKTKWPPQPIFRWLRILMTSDQLKEKLWIYHHQMFYMAIRWHKLGWYWFSTISEKQDGHHSQFTADSEFWRRQINERKSHEYIISKLFMRIYGGISLAGIDFQQFPKKNKMATTANFPQIFTLLSLIHQHLVSMVNFSCELGQIMTIYDFLWARWVILSNVRTDLNLT